MATTTSFDPARIKANVPKELRDLNQWVRYALVGPPNSKGKLRKVPINAADSSWAKSNDRSTWGTFDQALANVGKDDTVGVGFVFSDEDPYIGIDIDGCITDGEQTKLATDVINYFESYTETSPSGTGVHILIKGEWKRPSGLKQNQIEIYKTGRYFTFTGCRDNTVPAEIHDRGDRLEVFVAEVLTPEASPSAPAPVTPITLETANTIDFKIVPLHLRLQEAVRHLGNLEIAVEGEGGHNKLLYAAGVLVKGYLLPPEEAFNLLKTVYSPRCKPPFKNDNEIWHKISEADKKSRIEPGRYLVELAAKAQKEEAERPEPSKYIVNLRDVVTSLANEPPPIPTGIEGLDDSLGGFALGSFALLNGSPGSGKSAATTQMLPTLTKDHFVVYYPVDEGHRQLVKRLARHCGMTNQEIRQAENEALMWQHISGYIQLDNFVLLQPGDDLLDLKRLLALADELKPADKKLIVIVDSLHSLPLKNDKKDTRAAYTEMCMEIMHWTTKTGSILIGIAEQNRAAYASKNEADRPNQLASSAESRAFEFKSDYSISLTKGEEATNMANTSHYVTWNITKARDYRKEPKFVTIFDNKVTRHYPMSMEDVEQLKIEKDKKKEEDKLQREKGDTEWMREVIHYFLALGIPESVKTNARLFGEFVAQACRTNNWKNSSGKYTGLGKFETQIKLLITYGQISTAPYTPVEAIVGKRTTPPGTYSEWEKAKGGYTPTGDKENETEESNSSEAN